MSSSCRTVLASRNTPAMTEPMMIDTVAVVPATATAWARASRTKESAPMHQTLATVAFTVPPVMAVVTAALMYRIAAALLTVNTAAAALVVTLPRVA